MSKTTKVLLTVSVIWLMIACGCSYFSMYRPGITTRWQQEPTPPEPITRLELGESGEILSFTDNGMIYQFSYGSPSRWEEISEPTGMPSVGMSCEPSETNTKIVFPPPGAEISRVRVDCVMYETAIHLEVVLLEDGGIWSWEYDSYVYTELMLGFILLLCFVSGIVLLLVGLGMAIYQKVSNKEKS